MTAHIGDANKMNFAAKAAADLLDILQGIGLTVPTGRDHFGPSHVANSALQIISEALSTVHAQALAGQDEAVAAARVEGIKEGLEMAACEAGENGDYGSSRAIRALASTLQTTDSARE